MHLGLDFEGAESRKLERNHVRLGKGELSDLRALLLDKGCNLLTGTPGVGADLLPGELSHPEKAMAGAE